MRSPAQHPSHRGGEAPAELALELDLPHEHARPSSTGAPPPAHDAAAALRSPLPAPSPSAGGAAPVEDAPWGEDDDDLSGLQLAEEVAPRPPARTAQRTAATGPNAAEQAAAALSLDDVAARAGYGAAPSNPLLCAPYALRVYRRRRELCTQLVEQQVVHRETDDVLRQQLVAVVDELLCKPGMDLVGAAERAQQANARVQVQRAQFDDVDGETAARLDAMQQQLVQLAKQQRQAAADHQLAKVHLAACEQRRERLIGVRKELAAALQTAHERAARAAGPNAEFAPPEHAPKIAAYQGQLDACSERLEARGVAVRQARSTLADKAQQLRHLDRLLRDARQQRGAAQLQAEQRRAAPRAQLRAALKARHDVYEQLLQRIALERPQLIDNAAALRIEQLHTAIGANDDALAVLKRAIDAYDEQAYKRGVTLWLAAVVVVTLSLLWLVQIR
ncbi:MAG TPA: hypothetical protein ENK23_08165 [Sorangium sp.]|nr:hypothetical protein [Sorangium sp.]